MSGYTVRARILALMAERRLSVAATARALGWDRKYLIARLGGRGPLTASELANMADVFGVPVGELAGAQMLPAVAR